jgi:hypothetical protein
MVTYRSASFREHKVSPADTKSLARFKKRLGEESAFRPRSGEVAAIADSYRAELATILPADQARAIRIAADGRHKQRPNGPGRRNLSLSQANEQGVDLGKLKAVHNRHRRELEDLFRGGQSFSSGEVIARSLDFPTNWPETLMPPDDGIVYVPPFAESWERWITNEKDGDGKILRNDSYVEAQFGVLGAIMVVRNHDAGDWNHFDVGHGNGFFVPFTMPVTGTLQINADFICLLCRHSISTSDEWGWSDFWSFTKTACAISVFWNRDDNEPVSENVVLPLASGLDAHGDGESYPGTVVQVQAGEGRSVKFLTDVAFPAGKTVWIYAGVSNRIFATLNDVSIDASIDSRWQLTSLAISPA